MANYRAFLLGMMLITGLANHSVLAAQDPTAPIGRQVATTVKQPAVASSLPELHSIVCQQTCYVILNQQVLTKGDVIAGYRITNISEDQVTLSKGRQEWPLSLFPLDIKQ